MWSKRFLTGGSQPAAAAVEWPKALDGGVRAPVTRRDLEQQIQKAFEELREPVYRYLASTEKCSDAEDLTQEAFLRLYRHLQAGHGVDNVRAWIFRVARNLRIDAGRGSARHFAHATPAEWAAIQDARTDARPDPEAQLLDRERWEFLTDAMRGLTEKQRESLHLRAEGLTYREIAEVLGVSISTVVDAVRRALEKLGRTWHA